VKDPVPKWKSKHSEIILRSSVPHKVDANEIRNAVSTVIDDLPRKWRLHLTISYRVWRGNEILKMEDYLTRIKSAKEQLSDMMEVLLAGVKI
jgi:hypothetical protein